MDLKQNPNSYVYIYGYIVLSFLLLWNLVIPTYQYYFYSVYENKVKNVVTFKKDSPLW